MILKSDTQFLDQKFFRAHQIFDPQFHWTQNIFEPKKCLDPKLTNYQTQFAKLKLPNQIGTLGTIIIEPNLPKKSTKLNLPSNLSEI